MAGVERADPADMLVAGAELPLGIDRSSRRQAIEDVVRAEEADVRLSAGPAGAEAGTADAACSSVQSG